MWHWKLTLHCDAELQSSDPQAKLLDLVLFPFLMALEDPGILQVMAW